MAISRRQSLRRRFILSCCRLSVIQADAQGGRRSCASQRGDQVSRREEHAGAVPHRPTAVKAMIVFMSKFTKGR